MKHTLFTVILLILTTRSQTTQIQKNFLMVNDIIDLISSLKLILKSNHLLRLSNHNNSEGFLKESPNQLDRFIIIEGVLIGLSKNDQCTKCHDDVKNNEANLKKLIDDVIDEIIAGANIIEAISNLIVQFKEHYGFIMDDCRVMELIAIIEQLLNDTEVFDKFFDRIVMNLELIEGICNEIVLAIRNQDEIAIGKGVGEVMKIALEFYVD